MATTSSSITITKEEQSNFFASASPPSDYSITLPVDLNTLFVGQTLGAFPITDTGDSDPAQAITSDASSASEWDDQLGQLKTTWGALTDGEGTTFTTRMVDVLNSLFGTTTASNKRPLNTTKIQGWLVSAFANDVFTSAQFTGLRAMFVHAGKFDRPSGALQLAGGDKMGVVVEISTSATNMITVNFFLEQEVS